MKPGYPPLKTFRIIYNTEEKMFYMYDVNGELVGNHVNGRELGRDAWEMDADVVRYDYNLRLDEYIPLIPRHEKYKTRS